MNLVEVIPISRGVWTEQLSYFTSQPLPLGAIVKVMVRNKLVTALTISNEPLTAHKTELKNSTNPLVFPHPSNLQFQTNEPAFFFLMIILLSDKEFRK